MKLIIKNKKKYQILKKGAKRKSKRFTFYSMIKKYEEVYDELQ